MRQAKETLNERFGCAQIKSADRDAYARWALLFADHLLPGQPDGGPTARRIEPGNRKPLRQVDFQRAMAQPHTHSGKPLHEQHVKRKQVYDTSII